MPDCTLVVRDQVNVQFQDLDPFIRRKICETLKFMVPSARHMPAYKLGRWDGKISFATAGGGTYLNLLDRVLPMVTEAGYTIAIDDRRPLHQFTFPEVSETMLADRCWPDGHVMAGQPISLRDYQVQAIRTYLANLQSIQQISTGAGKAQPLDAKIKTPTGWITMGEAAIGTIVTTPDGRSAPIIGVFPQGSRPTYRVSFKDGRSTECSDEHLWTAYCVDWRSSRKRGNTPWKTLTTLDLIKHFQSSKRPVRVPLPVPPTTAPAVLPIDPYLMGVLLGDDSLKYQQAAFSSADKEIVDEVRSRLAADYEVRHCSRYDYKIAFTKNAYKKERAAQGSNRNGQWHRYRAAMDDAGLRKGSHEKFIPKQYLEDANVEQKLELIRGLLDTDGHVGRNGDISFTSTSEQLASDFAYLVRSVGGLASTSYRTPTYTYKSERRTGKIAYTVRVRYHSPHDLLKLSRKRDRVSAAYQYANSLKLQITGIDYIGEKPCQCISIDHPEHLYITDDFVVTHNTLMTAALSLLVEPHGRSIVIVPSKSLVEQTEEDYRNLGLDVGVYFGDRKEWQHQHVICTWQSLTVLAKNTRRDAADVPIGDFIRGVVCVMVDECHTLRGKELKELLCGPFANVPIRWGLTGTIPKDEHEWISLLCSIGPVVGEVRAADLQEKGVLANCDIEIVQIQDEEQSFASYQEEYAYLVTDPARLDFIAQYCTTLAEQGNTLILVDRIETGEALTEAIAGSVFISGRVKSKDRRAEYKEVQVSDDKIIIATYGVAAVGINIPRIFNLVLLEPGKSFVRVIQSIGRGLRKASDKDRVLIKDVTSSLKFSKRHLTKRKAFYTEAGYPHRVTKVSL